MTDGLCAPCAILDHENELLQHLHAKKSCVKSSECRDLIWLVFVPYFACSGCQLVLQSETKYFSQGSIVADSREAATGLMVITSGQVGVELPMDSDEADEEHRTPGGKALLYVFSRGSVAH